MAGKDSGDGPSLELPSFGLRRRRRDEQAVEPAPAPHPTESETTRAMPVAVDQQDPAPVPGPTPARRRKKVRRRPSLPPLAAAALTGAVVGLLLVGLMWAGLESCDFLIGTSSCGGGGVAMWLAILVLVVIVGRFLLRWFGLDEAGSTSFLGVGLTAVVILLLLSPFLEDPWMALVMPVVSAAAYALSHWVTTAFVEPTGPEQHR
jgi:hypothetical protein